MPETTRGLPYPATTDEPNVPQDMQNLAEATEALLPRIETGSATLTFSNQANANTAVTFTDGRFTSTPRIVITQAGLPANSGQLIAKYISPSSSGFTLYAYTGNAANVTIASVTFSWIAIQE